jgi:hypothetical protein
VEVAIFSTLGKIADAEDHRPLGYGQPAGPRRRMRARYANAADERFEVVDAVAGPGHGSPSRLARSTVEQGLEGPEVTIRSTD